MNFDIYNHIESSLTIFKNVFNNNIYTINGSSNTSNIQTQNTTANLNTNNENIEKKEFCYGLGMRTPEVPFLFNKLSNNNNTSKY